MPCVFFSICNVTPCHCKTCIASCPICTGVCWSLCQVYLSSSNHLVVRKAPMLGCDHQSCFRAGRQAQLAEICAELPGASQRRVCGYIALRQHGRTRRYGVHVRNKTFLGRLTETSAAGSVYNNHSQQAAVTVKADCPKHVALCA